MKLTTDQYNELRGDVMVKFLLKQLERAYAEGGDEAVAVKLEVYGLSSENTDDRESALTLARMWKERG